MLGRRVVVTHHGEYYRRAKWGFVARQMLRLGERFALRSADRLIAVSPSLTERLRAACPTASERIWFIHNGGPELPAPRADALTRLDLASPDYILAAARLVPETGLHELLDAHRAANDTAKPAIVRGTETN